MLPRILGWIERQERGYAAKYRGRGEAICLIGVEFSRETRNVAAFEVEQV